MTSKALPLLFLLAPVLAVAEADQLFFKEGDSLTGVISTISEDGRVTLTSENAAAPLVIREGALQRIVIDAPESAANEYSEVAVLSNGDKLPGTISALDGQSIGFDTNYSDQLTIPRAQTRSIDFGARPQRLVYRGPGKISEWEDNDNWQSAGKTLTNKGSGSISRPGILPAQFILRFRLEWEANPSVRFYFCDDLLKVQGDTDRYYFEFNSAGMQIKRQTAGDERRWSTIASIRRKPSAFPDSQVDIELRVDREQGLIYVYIDGKPEGHHRDHMSEYPTGSGIMLQSLASGDMKNIVSRIEIYDWDAVSQIRSDEGHEDARQDSLISSAGERFSGTAEELVARDDGSPGIVFSSPHSDESFTIPKNRISTLYFRKSAGSRPADSPRYKVFLSNSGQFSLSRLSLGKEKLTGTHPLLGEVSLNREAVARIVFFSEPDSEGAEPENSR